MEKAIQGKKIKLMFRLTRERATTAAKLLALEISHEYKSETKTDTQSTKDGNVPTSGMPSASIEMEFLRTGTETYNMLKYAYRNGLEIDVWRINFDKKDPKIGKYEAEFGTGLLDSFGDSAESDSNSSIKPTLVLNGDLVEGWATVDAENEELARAFFYDTVAGAEPEEPVEKYTPKTIEVPKVESVTPTSDGAVVKVKEEE